MIGVAVALVVVIALVAVAALAFSGVTLAGDSTALARVTVQPLGGTIEHVQAFGPGGQSLPLTDRRRAPDAAEAADAPASRCRWTWRCAGRAGSAGRSASTRSEHLTLRAPVAHVTEQWMTVPTGSPVRVSFEQPVSAVAYGSPGDVRPTTR